MGTPAVIPDVAALLDYLGLDTSNYDQAQAQEALIAALDVQAQMCEVDPYEQPLREAALRRAAAILSGRGAPLGTIDSGAFGTTPLVRFDAHIENLERNYRLGEFA
jgi:hypothetical protein